METFSALLAICAGNSPVPSEFPTQRPVMRCFNVCFDLRLNKRLSKQSRGWWFETQSRPLWRHSNVLQRHHDICLYILGWSFAVLLFGLGVKIEGIIWYFPKPGASLYWREILDWDDDKYSIRVNILEERRLDLKRTDDFLIHEHGNKFRISWKWIFNILFIITLTS